MTDKITIDRELLFKTEQLLDELRGDVNPERGYAEELEAEILITRDHLRAALNAPQQEAVGVVQETIIEDNSEWECIEWKSDRPPVGTLLYTHSAPSTTGCAECGKQASDGWALYCVECAEKIAPSVPEGWQLVPKEITEEMIRAGNAAIPNQLEPAMHAWDAMLSAAPKAPTTDDRKDAGITRSQNE